MGGLTVLRALAARLPEERFVYLGDTARLPYGTRSPETIVRYATQASRKLVDQGIKLLVVACNTASSVAIEHLREVFAPLPLVGVVEPGAAAAARTSTHGEIVVLATEGTIRGKAYHRAITRIRPGVRVTGQACSLFVALAEEGWTDGEVPTLAARRYLEAHLPALRDPDPARKLGARGPDCIVLGCTHFPVLRDVIAAVAGPEVALVDSAETTAEVVEQALRDRGLSAPSAGAEPAPTLRFMATDAPERFARVGSRFLGRAIGVEDVELVDL